MNGRAPTTALASHLNTRRGRAGGGWFCGAILVLLIPALGACGSGNGAGAPPGSTPPQPPHERHGASQALVVTDNAAAPPACQPRALAKTIMSLLAALNGGDRAALERAFVPKRRFAFYSAPRDPLDTKTLPEKLNFAVRDRSRLVSRLLEVHRGGERLSLRAVEGACDFGYHLRADSHGRPSTLLPGKGELDPRTGRIRAWALGPPRRLKGYGDIYQACGERVRPTGPILACAGR